MLEHSCVPKCHGHYSSIRLCVTAFTSQPLAEGDEEDGTNVDITMVTFLSLL